jgi:hypothetical protein
MQICRNAVNGGNAGNANNANNATSATNSVYVSLFYSGGRNTVA